MKHAQRGLSFAAVAGVLLASALIIAKNLPGAAGDHLVNVSYDPTRELYGSLNSLFLANYEKETGRHLKIIQSHGGSSRQARKVIDSEEPADVVTLGLFSDIALAIAKSIANQTRQTLDFNRQCLAEGIANLTGSFFRCLPGSGSLSRSAINFQAGGATRFSGILTAATVTIAVLALAPLARFVPKPALAAAAWASKYRR